MHTTEIILLTTINRRIFKCSNFEAPSIYCRPTVNIQIVVSMSYNKITTSDDKCIDCNSSKYHGVNSHLVQRIKRNVDLEILANASIA